MAGSTFTLQIGTPRQTVYVLPSTSGESLWVVYKLGCSNSFQPLSRYNCSQDRGQLFNIEASSTFQWIGGSRAAFSETFPLPFDAETALGGNYTETSQCYAGLDTAKLAYSESSVPTLQKQVILTYYVDVPYQGLLGLTSRPANLTYEDNHYSYDSPISTFRKQNHIPSTYWAYTAGAWYREPQYQAFGSLTFGGFDALRGNEHNVMTVPLAPANNHDLLVKITGISISSSSGGTKSALGSPIDAYINSVVPEIWLPKASCVSFESAFGLIWNEDLQMYSVSETQHKHLLSQNATVTMSLGAATTNDPSALTQIELPYGAFDQVATYPFIGTAEGAIRYFPLKRATSEDQYTLGRTFLQEA